MITTAIEWATQVWNPVTGCLWVSSGCANCYAERHWPRLAGNPATVYHGRKFTDVQTHPERLALPNWRDPQRVFVNSMSDLFHNAVPDSFIDQVFQVMGKGRNARHTFMILTKRPERMREYFGGRLCLDLDRPPAPNVWLGVSVEDQGTANVRIPELQGVPAAVRFISYEPAIGPVDFSDWFEKPWFGRIDWVIAGGESGPKARPANPDWFRSVRDQCQASGVAFFMKQMAKKVAIPDDLFIREFPRGTGEL